MLAHPQLVTLSCPLLAETPEGLRRSDGLATVERHGQRRWTTRGTLAREAGVLTVARHGKHAGVAVVDAETTAVAITSAVSGPSTRTRFSSTVWCWLLRPA